MFSHSRLYDLCSLRCGLRGDSARRFDEWVPFASPRLRPLTDGVVPSKVRRDFGVTVDPYGMLAGQIM